jgi:hypothetical protein
MPVFVRRKFTDAPLVRLAVTMYAPPMPLDVNVGEVAIPLLFVMTVVVIEFVSINLPLAPFAGAVNVTITPSTGFASASWISTLNGEL